MLSVPEAILGALKCSQNHLALALVQSHQNEIVAQLSTTSSFVTPYLQQSPLHLLAAQPPCSGESSLATFQLLNFFLARGRNTLENRDSLGQTPLLLAVDARNETVIKYLLENRAEVDTADTQGHIPLSLALHHNDRDLVRVLFKRSEHDGRILGHRTAMGTSLLHYACMHRGYLGLASRCIEIGRISVDLRNRAGDSPLIFAARAGITENVEWLLRRGARPNLRGSRGRTALHAAVLRGDLQTAGLLLLAGGSASQRDQHDLTPLDYCALLLDDQTRADMLAALRCPPTGPAGSLGPTAASPPRMGAFTAPTSAGSILQAAPAAPSGAPRPAGTSPMLCPSRAPGGGEALPPVAGGDPQPQPQPQPPPLGTESLAAPRAQAPVPPAARPIAIPAAPPDPQQRPQQQQQPPPVSIGRNVTPPESNMPGVVFSPGPSAPPQAPAPAPAPGGPAASGAPMNMSSDYRARCGGYAPFRFPDGPLEDELVRAVEGARAMGGPEARGLEEEGLRGALLVRAIQVLAQVAPPALFPPPQPSDRHHISRPTPILSLRHWGLIRLGANPNTLSPTDGQPVLVHAVLAGWPALCCALLEAGADVHAGLLTKSILHLLRRQWDPRTNRPQLFAIAAAAAPAVGAPPPAAPVAPGSASSPAQPQTQPQPQPPARPVAPRHPGGGGGTALNRIGALHAAAMANDMDAFRLLLAAGAGPSGGMAGHGRARDGHAHAASTAAGSDGGCDCPCGAHAPLPARHSHRPAVGLPDWQGRTVYHTAAQCGHVTLLYALLTAPSTSLLAHTTPAPPCPEERDPIGATGPGAAGTALALARMQTDMLVNLRTCVSGDTLLLCACRGLLPTEAVVLGLSPSPERPLQTVRLLVGLGADPQATNWLGEDGLMVAWRAHRSGLVTHLLRCCGLLPARRLRATGETVLHWAPAVDETALGLCLALHQHMTVAPWLPPAEPGAPAAPSGPTASIVSAAASPLGAPSSPALRPLPAAPVSWLGPREQLVNARDRWGRTPLLCLLWEAYGLPDPALLWPPEQPPASLPSPAGPMPPAPPEGRPGPPPPAPAWSVPPAGGEELVGMDRDGAISPAPALQPEQPGHPGGLPVAEPDLPAAVGAELRALVGAGGGGGEDEGRAEERGAPRWTLARLVEAGRAAAVHSRAGGWGVPAALGGADPAGTEAALDAATGGCSCGSPSYLPRVQAFLRAGARPNEAMRPECGGYTPLHLAAARGDLDVIVLFLSAGVDPYQPDSRGLTAVHHAATQSRPDAFLLLLQISAAVVPEWMKANPGAAVMPPLDPLLDEDALGSPSPPGPAAPAGEAGAGDSPPTSSGGPTAADGAEAEEWAFLMPHAPGRPSRTRLAATRRPESPAPPPAPTRPRAPSVSVPPSALPQPAASGTAPGRTRGFSLAPRLMAAPAAVPPAPRPPAAVGTVGCRVHPLLEPLPRAGGWTLLHFLAATGAAYTLQTAFEGTGYGPRDARQGIYSPSFPCPFPVQGAVHAPDPYTGPTSGSSPPAGPGDLKALTWAHHLLRARDALRGETPLLTAARCGQLVALYVIVARGLVPAAAVGQSSPEAAALRLAGDLVATDRWGRTYSQLAARRGGEEMALTARSVVAIALDRADLLARGMRNLPLDDRPALQGYTLLHLAAWGGHRRVVDFLLGLPSVAELLADYGQADPAHLGAYIDRRDVAGATALHLAAMCPHGHMHVPEEAVLRVQGERYPLGPPQMSFYRSQQVLGCFRQLVARGADLSLTDCAGRTVIDLLAATVRPAPALRCLPLCLTATMSGLARLRLQGDVECILLLLSLCPSAVAYRGPLPAFVPRSGELAHTFGLFEALQRPQAPLGVPAVLGTAEGEDMPLKAGFLLRRGPFRSSWSVLLFGLTLGRLTCWPSVTEGARPKDIIALADVTALSDEGEGAGPEERDPTEASPDGGALPAPLAPGGPAAAPASPGQLMPNERWTFAVHLRGAGRPLRLAACDGSERDGWLRALRFAIGRAREVAASPGGSSTIATSGGAMGPPAPPKPAR
ncbi:hypothetical protein PAPYR_7521 [Paratrimastix pyriformis]|uniref:PH domain-containing protein n=1 Tax=Paratrimastix pyriformis TaxID=342808 RepID=A0ABQ8UCY3_9EUKA|nr:hypothetical protein PAPYR_7521 [Paratrimastix pyriformis]